MPMICMLCAMFGQTPLAGSQTASQAPVPAARQANVVAVIDVTTPIDSITTHSIQRRAKKAHEEGAEVLVFNLDTPGGELEAMLDICRFIKQDAPLPTAAWINPEAYSAGALIAIATNGGIIMVPGSRMGDAAPVAGIPGAGLLQLPQAERAKLEGPLLAEVIDSARRNGYDEKLVQSFVGVRFALWELERRDGGERIFVDANEYQRIYGEPPPIQRARGATPVLTSSEPVIPPETETTIEVVQDLVSGRASLGPEDADDWVLRGQVVGDEELLVVGPEDALRMGLARAIVPDETSLQRWFGAESVVHYHESWSELLVRFLTSMPVRIVLIAILVVGFFLEIAAPGASIFGGAALLALTILIGAPMMVGLTNWWEILCIVLGLTLIGVELVLMPGIAVAGILGGVFLLVGIVGIMVTADFGTPQANTQIVTAIVAIVGASLAGGVGAWWVARRSGGFWLFRRMVLDAQSATPTTETPVGAPRKPLPSVGRSAQTATDLRPSGRIEIDGTLHAARSTTGWIDEGTPVRILRKFAGEFEVEPLDVPPTAERPKDNK